MIKNIILILVILFLLNYIKIVPRIDDNNEQLTSSNNAQLTSSNINDNININNVNISKNIDIPRRNLYFGKDQYITKPDNNNNDLYYQDLEIFKKQSDIYFNYDISTTDNLYHYDDSNLTMNLNTPIIQPEKSQVYYENNPLINQDILYDNRALSSYTEHNKDILINSEHINYENKDIKEIYDDLIFDHKNINQRKNPTTKNIKVDGAFNQNAVPISQWFYEDDNIDELHFDPIQTLELSVQK